MSLERYPRERSVEHKRRISPERPRGGQAVPNTGLLRPFNPGSSATDVRERLANVYGMAVGLLRLSLLQRRHHGIRSRVGRGRADLAHQPLHLANIAVPALLAFGAIYALSSRRRERARRVRREMQLRPPEAAE